MRGQTGDAKQDFTSRALILWMPDLPFNADGFVGSETADPSTFTLFTWVLGSTAAGNMTISTPAIATSGTTGAINLTFSGLAAGTKYLGSVVYGGATGMPNPTIVRVDVP